MKKDLHILGKNGILALSRFANTTKRNWFFSFRDNEYKLHIYGLSIITNFTVVKLHSVTALLILSLFLLSRYAGADMLKLQLTPAKSLETKQTSKAQAIQNSRNIRLAEKCNNLSDYVNILNRKGVSYA